MSYTSRLLNYVEPYYIDGIAKTAFWTEVNTNLQRNDKVFIANGYYDSEVFIRKGKWVKNADGYRVLFVDRCKVVLDIDWESGQFAGLTQTYRQDDFDSFIKVYNVRSQREFDYVNRIQVDSYTQSRVSKFEQNLTNNLIYSDKAWAGATGFGRNNGTQTTKSFWARSGHSWVNLTSNFIGNTLTFSSAYYAAGLTNNSRFFVLGEDINYGGRVLKERNVYRWVGNADWAIDKDYKQPIISKLYFKQGVFRGTHNDGVFGSYDRGEVWSGTPSVWNSGFLVNSDWESGRMSSKSTAAEQSYYSALVGGAPVQTTDFSNNKGYGYNYMLDSNLISGTIDNGNAINCNVGVYSPGLTAVDAYFGATLSFGIETAGGFYNYCDVANARMADSTTLDSVIRNSFLDNTRAFNSQLQESYSLGGEFSVNEGGIRVTSADLAGYIISGTSATHSDIRAALKLYIDDADLNRLDTFDSFYLTRINKEYILSSLDSDLRVWLPVETKYILDTFYDFPVGGANQQCVSSLKTKSDNAYITTVEYDGSVYTTRAAANGTRRASIDVDLSSYLAFYLRGGVYTFLNQSYIDKSVVNNLFKDTSVSNSEFRDGVAKGINWRSGSHLNYPSNIIKWENGNLKILKVAPNQILVTLAATQSTIEDNIFRKGSYVWLDSVRHLSDMGTVSNISGVYTVATHSQDQLILQGASVSGIPAAGTYSVMGGQMPSYLSVHKLLIDGSTVANGLFIRNLFRGTTFEDELFDSNDAGLTNNNIQRLRVINNYLYDSTGSRNTVRAGLFHNGHMLDVNWESGISDNSIWHGPDFKGGVFNYGIWEDGTFSGGRFQNSRGLTYTPEDYSYVGTHYRNWRRGTFNSGEFYNSVWLEGTFNLGKMWGSDWYGGVWNNGILGDANTPTTNTTMAKYLNIGTGATQTAWYNGVVENAEVGGLGHMTWYDGSFNGGVFSASASNSTNRSLWAGGQFNGGNFSGMAKWKDGTFNGGKFQSHFGFTLSSSTSSADYSWENGSFKGGEFGVESGMTNSTWYYGLFEGGIFKGRVWNSGIFTNGYFEGSGIQSPIADPSSFCESFTQSYWGLWRDGTVTDVKHKADPTIAVEANQRPYDERPGQLVATIKNALWLGGVFNHPNGSIVNSAWLDGKFRKGGFSDGVFNPYVRRDWWESGYGTHSAFNFDLAGCVWENGKFDGAFFISDWLDGEFLGGTMTGARWFNGVWRYGWANNIYWENGTWKNGNWDGSPFDLNTLTFTQSRGDVVPGPERDILLRVGNIHRDGRVHIINAFTGSFSGNKFAGWTHSQTDASLTQWTEQPGTPYYYLSKVYPTTPRIEQNLSIFNTFTQSFSNVSVYELEVKGDIYDNDEYRLSLYGGYVSVTASSADALWMVAERLVDQVNRGRTEPVVRYEQWTANGYVTRYFTWVQLVDVATRVLDPITLLPMDPADVAVLFTQLPVATQPNPSGASFTVVTTNDTLVRGQAISGFAASTAYIQSERIYAMVNAGGLTSSVFTQSNVMYNVTLDISNEGGRTDFVVHISDTTHRESVTSDGSSTFNYSLVTSSALQEKDFNMYVERVLYQGPDNSSLQVQDVRINVLEAEYDREFNNKLYRAATYSQPFRYGPTGTSMSLPGRLLSGIVVNNEAVSIKYGNGAFKYGIWETGYWNNGWHASWGSEPEYFLFKDILQGGFVAVSDGLWAIKLAALTNTDGINIGERVSIGNIVFVDINENRRLVKKPYRVVNKTATTLTVEVNVNFAVRRIERDSSLHLMYVSKNVWQSGIFHNGFFRGVWNYGLFRGYPYITEMHGTQWVDGIFDGGSFRSSRSYYADLGVTQSYNNGLVQNFIFRDNNVAPLGGYKYNSWVDTNFYTYSMTNLFRDNLGYDSTWGVVKSTGNLKGYPSEDVLASRSIFRNSFDLAINNYSLGSKGREYVDFLGRSAYFTYPANSSGAPGVAEFLANGWTYSIRSLDFHSNAKGIAGQGAAPDYGVLQVNYQTESFTNTGVKFVQTSKVRYLNNNFHVVGVPPTLVPAANNSVQGDFSSNPAGSPGYSVFQDGNPLSGVKFSNHSYQYNDWPHKANFPMNVSALGVYVNNGNTPTPLPTGFLQVDGQHTIAANRRVYMFDRFNPTSTDAQYGGYAKPSSADSFDFQVENPVTSNVAGSNWTYMKFRVKKATRLRMNAEVPFKFFAAEGPSGGGIGNRDGWSIFRIVGVVEKYSGTTAPTEADWRYVTHTQLNFYPQSKASSVDGSLRGYAIDKVSGTIAYDDMLTSTSNFFVGYLSITGFEQDFAAGDLIRFRLYWMDMRKSFASLNDKYNSGSFFFPRREQVGAPGYMDLIIGKDETMPYTQNNHGYWEIIDTSTYVNQNTNILNNTKSEAIERGRYSVIDFDIVSAPLSNYQGTSSVGADLLPNIFLLNSEYEGLPGGFSDVVNHGLTTGNKKEYFYNRKSLSMFFKAVETFSVQFSKIKFYETDMIPFFRYTDEPSVNDDPQSPYYGKAPEPAIPDSSLSLDTISYTSPFAGNIPIRSSLISSGGGLGPTGPGPDTGGDTGGGNPPTPPSVLVNYSFFTNTEYTMNYTTYTIVVKDTMNTTVRTVTQTLTQGLQSVSGNMRVAIGHFLELSIQTTITSVELSLTGVNLSIDYVVNTVYQSVEFLGSPTTGTLAVTVGPVTTDTTLLFNVNQY